MHQKQKMGGMQVMLTIDDHPCDNHAKMHLFQDPQNDENEHKMFKG